MLDALITWLKEIWNDLLPYTIIEQTNKAVHLRFGKFLRELEPGLWWKVPFFDSIGEHTVVMTTMDLPSQSLTTADDSSIVVSAIVKYEIFDIKIFALECNDAVDAISDMVRGIISDKVRESSWDEIRSGEFDRSISQTSKAEAKRWGIRILKVTLSDRIKTKSIRLIGEGLLG